MYSDRLATLFDRKDYPVDAFDIRKRLHGRELIAYGAGECCHWFVEIVMKIHGYRPSVFLDRRFSAGDLFEGIPAMSPDAFQPGEDQKANAVAVICSGNEKYVGEIRERLRTMGIRDILLLRDVYEVHNPFSLPSELAREGFGYYSRHEREIRDALELLQDDESREVYVRCLQTHMERRPTLLPQRPRKEQYFPRDIALGKGYDRFVCCGSYDGDTVRLLNEVIGKVRDIVCFEPEGHLFARLADNISSQSRTLAERIVCLPCAVYDEDRTLRFASGSGLGSRIAEWGNALVQAVRLDHALPGFEPTFICMDVEGVELNVLQGSRRVLSESRPDLGVCVYHAPNQLWEIPLFLHGLRLGYRLFLRNYTGFTQETVLYATV